MSDVAFLTVCIAVSWRMTMSALQFVTAHYAEFKLGVLSVTDLAGQLKVAKKGNTLSPFFRRIRHYNTLCCEML